MNFADWSETMRTLRRTPITFAGIAPALLAAVLLASAIPPAHAAETGARVTVGTLVIERPWTRATPGGATVGAGYLTITNTGQEPDILVGGTADIAGRVEVHEMSESGGVMRMRPLADGLAIPAGQTVELKPSGAHLMFTGLKQPIEAGKPFKATLEFRSAGTVEVAFEVALIGAAAPGHDHH